MENTLRCDDCGADLACRLAQAEFEQAEYGHACPKRPVVIGTYHLAATTVFDVPQEFAGAAHQIEVPAGDYAVAARLYQGKRYACVVLPGEHVYSHWTGCNTDTRRRPETHYLQPYWYELGSWACRGLVTLRDGWTAQPFEYDSEYTRLADGSYGPGRTTAYRVLDPSGTELHG